jgi:hypothetical protein
MTNPGENRMKIKRDATIDDNGQVPKEVAEFAPKKYLTNEMIMPVSDPMRLADVTGNAVAHIGTATADQIDLVAISIVENAKAGAQALIEDAKVQADKMIVEAAAISAEMSAFAADIRAYSDRKAEQVSAFCEISKSVIGTMHMLNDQFGVMSKAEVEAMRRLAEAAQAADIPLPRFLDKGKRGDGQ